MEYLRVSEKDMEQLRPLQTQYKRAIGEEAPGEEDFSRLFAAIKSGDILFYACRDGEKLVGCCSVSLTFSTFNYRRSGVFEDFFILPEYRHQGIARALVEYAVEESGVRSLTVGCADCDAAMYKALGFSVPLGNLLAFDL